MLWLSFIRDGVVRYATGWDGKPIVLSQEALDLVLAGYRNYTWGKLPLCHDGEDY